jgi:hypothetical protein
VAAVCDLADLDLELLPDQRITVGDNRFRTTT